MVEEKRAIWVFIEQERGEVNTVSWELLGKGRQLASDLRGELVGILLGHELDDVAPAAFAYGADKLMLIDDPLLAHYTTFAYSRGLINLARKEAPEIILLGASTLGRDIASPVATALGTGLTADCTELEIDDETKQLKQTRPAFGGNIMATILCRNSRPQMATVRPRVFPVPRPDFNRDGAIVRAELGVAPEDMPARVLEFIPADAQEVIHLEAAEVIISGGRGIISPENLGLLHELAELMGGEVGASRPLIDMGWMPYARQVGQTGKTVRPRLYLAAGISGAIQHLVGMEGSEVIVAINSDPEAPIFKVATYGVVGDALEVLPALVAEIKQRKAGEAVTIG